MIATFSAVMLASLLGSTHCAGMCGAFVAIATARPPEGMSCSASGKACPSRSRAALITAYNVGRLVTYTVLGTIAGTIGAGVDLGGSAVGIQRAAAIFAGLTIMFFGIVAVLRHLNVPIKRAPVPKFMRDLVVKAGRLVAGLPPLTRASAMGLLTTLLPCGWLWAFVVTAAGTGSSALGALVMACFWIGTLPIMISLGIGLQTLAARTGRLGRAAPLIVSLLMVGVGLFSVVSRAGADFGDTFRSLGTRDQAGAVPDAANPPSCPLCDTTPKNGR